MTKARRRILIVGLLLMMLIGLFPPGRVVRSRLQHGETFRYYADRRVFLPCDTGRVQYHALMVEWVVIAAGTGIAFLIAHPRKEAP